MGRAHIVGAGLAGLAAAVRLAEAGAAVTLYEAAGQAGGRCRSFFDDTLGRRIDNGNHLLLSGNGAAMAYLATIGAQHTLAGPDGAAFPFLDLATGTRWTLRPGRSALPFWLFDETRRVPDTQPADYLGGLSLFFAGQRATVADILGAAGVLYRRFWEPLAIAVLNAPAERAAACLLVPVLLRTFARGEAACRPRIARDGLSESLVEPALAFLRARGADIRMGERLATVDAEGTRATALAFARGPVALGADDVVILALPPLIAAAVLPGLVVPEESSPIVNVHFRLDRPAGPSNEPTLLGLVGGAAQWLFLRGDIVSVTVSAADDLAREPASAIAATVWADVARALDLSGPLPLYRVVKERRATFTQDPDGLARRPRAATRWRNLWLAGDWTRTGLPATIEGAVQSGFHAAAKAARQLGHRAHPARQSPSVAPAGPRPSAPAVEERMA